MLAGKKETQHCQKAKLLCILSPMFFNLETVTRISFSLHFSVMFLLLPKFNKDWIRNCSVFSSSKARHTNVQIACLNKKSSPVLMDFLYLYLRKRSRNIVSFCQFCWSSLAHKWSCNEFFSKWLWLFGCAVPMPPSGYLAWCSGLPRARLLS